MIYSETVRIELLVIEIYLNVYIVKKGWSGSMIEVCFADPEERMGIKRRLLQWFNQKRGVCREYEKEYLEEELAVMELACTYEQGGKLGTAWFEKCIRRIHMQYPRQLIYFSEDVCRKYAMPEYQKKWICWYSLFPEIWEQMMQHYQIKEQGLDVVLVDTGNNLAFFLCRELATRVRHLEIVTKRGSVWNKICEEVEEECGLLIEIKRKISSNVEGKMIVDVLGTKLSQYSWLVEKNQVFALGITEIQKEYMKNRVKNGNLICGFTQSIYGEKVSPRFAAIFMQSQNWKLRNMADFFEEWEGNVMELGWEELEKIKERYQWKVDRLEIR